MVSGSEQLCGQCAYFVQLEQFEPGVFGDVGTCLAMSLLRLSQENSGEVIVFSGQSLDHSLTLNHAYHVHDKIVTGEKEPCFIPANKQD